VYSCKQWLEDSSVAVQEVLSSTLERLQQLGATVVDITLPDLEQIQVSTQRVLHFKHTRYM
jgi:hypothetical protein